MQVTSQQESSTEGPNAHQLFNCTFSKFLFAWKYLCCFFNTLLAQCNLAYSSFSTSNFNSKEIIQKNKVNAISDYSHTHREAAQICVTKTYCQLRPKCIWSHANTTVLCFHRNALVQHLSKQEVSKLWHATRGAYDVTGVRLESVSSSVWRYNMIRLKLRNRTA